jgi:hypothetical protein
MNPRPFVLVLATPVLATLVLAGCATPAPTPRPSVPATTATAPAGGGDATTPAPPPASEPNDSGIEYRVSYGFDVPSSPVTITHDVHPPPLPYLVGVYTGNHPEGTPAYQRISYYFRVGFPSYTFRYVPQVISDGRGAPVPLLGNSFLSVVFTTAQAHNDAGASTVVESAPPLTGFPNLRNYAPAGDFEGNVSYGLGIQTAANSDQVLRIRAGELKRPDNSGGFFYVVHFDVQSA